MIKIGVIADDFTGATDIASFLVENGLPTVQINGVPTGKMPEAIDALVISLKTRSCPVVEATQQSLAALSWLQQQGCNSKVANRSISNTALLSTVRRKGISVRLPMH